MAEVHKCFLNADRPMSMLGETEPYEHTVGDGGLSNPRPHRAAGANPEGYVFFSSPGTWILLN